MRRFLADIHLHTDYDAERDRWHGMPPKELAQAAVDSPLDIIAVTEHNGVSGRYFDVVEEVQRLTEGTERQLRVLLGMELAVSFENDRYHVGYIFEEAFERGNLPTTPEAAVNLRYLEEYRTYYPGATVFEHPTWKAGCAADLRRVRDLMESGLVDGAELINGSVLCNGNGRGKAITAEAWRIFVEARKKQPSLAAVGSSDAHKPRQVALAATSFDAEEAQWLFTALRRGTTRAAPLQDQVRVNINALLDEHAGIRRFMDVAEA